MILIYLLLFTAAVIFSFYVPGKLLIEFLKLEFSPLEKTVYATVSGLALFFARDLHFFVDSGAVGISINTYNFKFIRYL